jgi:transcriptional regulator with XRE-family HTH domain
MPHGPPRLRTADQRQNLAGPHIKARRQQLNLTQDDLCARLADITGGRWNPSIYDIYRIEAQRRIVSDLEMLALALALECSLYVLIGATPENPTFPA